MYTLLLTILVLDGLFLGVVILLQSGKGGGLAAMGGGAAATDILGGRQATTVLTRATWTAGTIFMVLAFVLSIMSSRATQPESILQPDTNAPAVAPEPLLPPTGGAEADAPAGAAEEPVPAAQPSESNGTAPGPDAATEEPEG
jgi:preprotein translocase subunit SecG